VPSEKEILPPAIAVRRASTAERPLEEILDGARSKGVPSINKQRRKFVKLDSVAQKLRFRDGSTFQFRLIKRNDGNGYMSNSFVVTDDETLINNLKEAALNKASGVVEVEV
jgi:hypothetical protein